MTGAGGKTFSDFGRNPLRSGMLSNCGSWLACSHSCPVFGSRLFLRPIIMLQIRLGDIRPRRHAAGQPHIAANR